MVGFPDDLNDHRPHYWRPRLHHPYPEKEDIIMEFYTDQILDDNFHRIITFESDVLDTLSSLTTLAERTEIRLSVLEKMAARPVIVKNSKLLILTVMGLSFYAGYKYAEERAQQRALDREYARMRPSERAAEREEELRRNQADHPAGSKIPGQYEVKINGTNDPRPES